MFSVGQIFGILILGLTVVAPGLALGGFHGGTSWSVFAWLCVSLPGGAIGGLLLAPKHRISGAIGGIIGAPCALMALYLYSRNRDVIFRAEASLISFLGGLPGFGVFFVLRLISDLVFPAPREKEYDDEDDDDQRRDRIYDKDDEDDRPRKRKRRDDDDDDDEDEDERPRSRKRRDDDEDERPRARRRRHEDD
jgi:hypothetical protein